MEKTEVGAGNAKKESSPENQKKVVKVFFGVFFDGTGAGGYLSRNREKTNVELLHTYYTKRDNICKLYLTGIGVPDTAGDVVKDTATAGGLIGALGGPIGTLIGTTVGATAGAAAAMIGGNVKAAGGGAGLVAGIGATGIESKVMKAMKDIPNKIIEKNFQESNIQLYFEVFGFSRGATAARHFVWQVTNKKESIKKSIDKKLKANKSEIASITISYAGLFDTVSSLGLNISNGKNDNVKELGLDAIKAVEHVFHICAADEFRKNFDLTNINSAGAKGKEIFIPGSHTDIGGGSDPNKENKKITLSKSDETIHEGWTDGKVKSGYSHIALNLMATDFGKGARKKFKDIHKHKVKSQLKNTEQTIRNNMSRLKSPENCHNLKKEFNYEYLRANWLHFSAKEFDLINCPRKVNGNLKRGLIDG